jgi:hypothetical protein
VLLLDLVCRKRGEQLLKKMMSPKRVSYLKVKMEQHAAIVLVIACLAPPPFPFTAMMAAASALQYPRMRLILVVFGARIARFSLLGWAAIRFHRQILRIERSSEFIWFMGGFAAVCVIGSVFSVVRWVRLSRSKEVKPSAA